LKQESIADPVTELTKVQFPFLEQSGTAHCLGVDTQAPDKQILKDPQVASVLQDGGELLENATETADTHAELLSPGSPIT
jgi:hypothetical protein